MQKESSVILNDELGMYLHANFPYVPVNNDRTRNTALDIGGRGATPQWDACIASAISVISGSTN